MKQSKLVSVQPLVAAFQTAFVTSATAEAAVYEAEQSEHAIVQHLQDSSSGQYLQPQTLSGEQDAVTRASLDAHIKKVQAQQLQNASASDLQRAWHQARADYIGKRVQIRVIMAGKQPIVTIWYDQRYGYRDAVATRPHINGIIEDVLLDRNALLIKPSATARLLNSSLTNFMVYVIDPETFSPLVEITLR